MSDWLIKQIADNFRLNEIISRVATRWKHKASDYAHNKGASTYTPEEYFYAAVEAMVDCYTTKELKGKKCSVGYYYKVGISAMHDMARKDRKIKLAEKGFAQKQGYFNE